MGGLQPCAPFGKVAVSSPLLQISHVPFFGFSTHVPYVENNEFDRFSYFDSCIAACWRSLFSQNQSILDQIEPKNDGERFFFFSDNFHFCWYWKESTIITTHKYFMLVLVETNYMKLCPRLNLRSSHANSFMKLEDRIQKPVGEQETKQHEVFKFHKIWQ